MELNCNLCRFRTSTALDIYHDIEGFKDLIQLEFDPCTIHTTFRFSDYEWSNVFLCLKQFEREILELPATKSHGIHRTLELIASRKTGNNQNIENNRVDNDDYYDTELLYGSMEALDIRLLMMKVRKINIANSLHQEKLFRGNANIQTMINRSLLEVYLERKREQLNTKLSKILEDSYRERSWNEPEIQLLCKFGIADNNSKFIRSLNCWYKKRLDIPPPLEPCIPDVPILSPPSIIVHQPQVKRKQRLSLIEVPPPEKKQCIVEDVSEHKVDKLLQIYEHCKKYEDLKRIAIEFHDAGEKLSFLRDLIPDLIQRTTNFTKGLQELAHLIERGT